MDPSDEIVSPRSRRIQDMPIMDTYFYSTSESDSPECQVSSLAQAEPSHLQVTENDSYERFKNYEEYTETFRERSRGYFADCSRRSNSPPGHERGTTPLPLQSTRPHESHSSVKETRPERGQNKYKSNPGVLINGPVPGPSKTDTDCIPISYGRGRGRRKLRPDEKYDLRIGTQRLLHDLKFIPQENPYENESAHPHQTMSYSGAPIFPNFQSSGSSSSSVITSAASALRRRPKKSRYVIDNNHLMMVAVPERKPVSTSHTPTLSNSDSVFEQAVPSTPKPSLTAEEKALKIQKIIDRQGRGDLIFCCEGPANSILSSLGDATTKGPDQSGNKVVTFRLGKTAPSLTSVTTKDNTQMLFLNKDPSEHQRKISPPPRRAQKPRVTTFIMEAPESHWGYAPGQRLTNIAEEGEDNLDFFGRPKHQDKKWDQKSYKESLEYLPPYKYQEYEFKNESRRDHGSRTSRSSHDPGSRNSRSSRDPCPRNSRDHGPWNSRDRGPPNSRDHGPWNSRDPVPRNNRDPGPQSSRDPGPRTSRNTYDPSPRTSGNNRDSGPRSSKNSDQ